ncbi:MAG: sel1 repeat family protein [Legionellales bacterium]|nr:sel1 repeat family protein [Legionellales bacterium]
MNSLTKNINTAQEKDRKAETTHEVSEELIRIFNKNLGLAESGDVDAMIKVSLHYEKGWGIEQNENISFNWLEKAVEKGSGEAQYEMAKYFLKSGNNSQALSWLIKSSDSGYCKAQYSLGWAYYFGTEDCDKLEFPVKENKKEGFKLLKKAARQDYLWAVWFVREINEFNKILERANSGNVYAMLQISVSDIYQRHTKDSQKISWLEKAAAKGDERSKARLKVLRGVIKKALAECLNKEINMLSEKYDNHDSNFITR